MPQIAVITRTKDRPLLLERNINTVLNQGFADWSHIIVNDGGDSRPVEELAQKYGAKYSGRLKLIHNQTSIGMEAASNLGIKNSESQYIVILDDDDTWEADFLQKTVSYLENNPKTGGVMTYSYYVIEKIEGNQVITLDKYPYNTDIKYFNLFDTVIKKVYPPTMSFVFKRACYDTLGGFNEDFQKAGDIEFAVRFLAEYDIDVIPELLSNVHTRPQASGIYSNSSLGNKNYKDNAYWENKLKNHLLRLDLKENKLGIGFIYNLLTKLSPVLSSDNVKNRLLNLKDKRIVLYGAGIRAKELLDAHNAEFSSLNVVGVLDQDSQKHGTDFYTYKIYPPASITDLKPEAVILTVANTSMVKPFVEKLTAQSGLKCQIVCL